MTGMYSLTLVLANATDVNGLPALPFLSFGFLLANGDLLWRRLRPRRADPRSSSATHSTCGVCGNMSTGVTRRSS